MPERGREPTTVKKLLFCLSIFLPQMKVCRAFAESGPNKYLSICSIFFFYIAQVKGDLPLTWPTQLYNPTQSTFLGTCPLCQLSPPDRGYHHHHHLQYPNNRSYWKRIFFQKKKKKITIVTQGPCFLSLKQFSSLKSRWSNMCSWLRPFPHFLSSRRKLSNSLEKHATCIAFMAKLGNFHPRGASSRLLPTHTLKLAERPQREFHAEIADLLNVNSHQSKHAEPNITSFENFRMCQRKWNHRGKP